MDLAVIDSVYGRAPTVFVLQVRAGCSAFRS